MQGRTLKASLGRSDIHGSAASAPTDRPRRSRYPTFAVKVLLIYPDIRGHLRVSPRGYFYNGIACISAVLKQHGHEVRFLHYLAEPSRERFEADVLADATDLIGYSSTTNLFPFIQTWSRWCRERLPDVHQICGGVHPTLNRDQSLLTSELDAVCVGEGEWPMVELCDHLQRGGSAHPNVPNLTFKDRAGTLHRNAPRPLMTGKELDRMPYADRALFCPDKICDPNRPILIASRGCPYDCSYCCNRALLDVLGKTNPVRVRSVDNVIGEIDNIRESLPHVDGLHFDDDIFGMKLSWMREFSASYRAHVGLPFGCNMRPNLAGEEMVRLLTEAGCDEVALGVETGNPELRLRLLRRKTDDELLISAFRRFERAGISVHSFNMVGIPHETMKNSLETIKLNASLRERWKMHELRISIFYPYVGTPLFEEARRQNLLTGRNVTYYADDTVLNLGTMSGSQIRFVARYFRPLVVVYQRLHRDLGKPGLALAAMLDRFLLSTSARRCVFPVANAVYPLFVKFARWWKARTQSRPPAQTAMEIAPSKPTGETQTRGPLRTAAS